MYAEQKKFQYTGKDKSIIYLVEIEFASHGTDINLHFISDNKVNIAACLSAESFSIQIQNANSISIHARSYDRYTIRKSLEILSKNEFINADFAKEIGANFPFYGELLSFGLFKQHDLDLEEENLVFALNELVSCTESIDAPKPETTQPTRYLL